MNTSDSSATNSGATNSNATTARVTSASAANSGLTSDTSVGTTHIERETFAYGNDPFQVLDLYQPSTPNGAAIIDIHGGGWVQGSRLKEERMATRFAQAGYLVVAPDYRLADGLDKATYPAQVDDMLSVYQWLKALDRPGFNGQRIGAFGSSSGGNLSVELAVRVGIPAASWSGLLDLEGFMKSHLDTIPKRAIIDDNAPSASIDQGGPNDAYYKWLVINLLDGDLTLLHEATVINRVDAQTGPLFLANSTDELVPIGELLSMAQAATAARRPFWSTIIPGSAHAMGYYNQTIEPTLDFFAVYL
ncbi:MAG: alpha/beta hydrolase [Coriobacteriales bacterium]|jgi:acetyl esterase/lipase|nr:alpha/beta hydrolase [Coriobacteriales bacterium]